jgi:hypothetical protein
MKTLFSIILPVICLIITGCTEDYQIIDHREVRVVVDSYVQPSPIEDLDVLVVLDTSGSMTDNYEDVASGMDLLRLDIESLTLDYQFGYITMDPTELGYVGPYDSSSTVIDMLMAPSLLPMTMLEEGFSATYAFLNSEDGLNFKRPEADFLLFLISDEDEQSSLSADIFHDWLDQEFQDVQHDVVCVVNPDYGQDTSWGNEIGYKYIELANLYTKDIIDIEEEDWSIWLSDSSYLTERKDYIVLSENDPILDSMIVYVDQYWTREWYYIESTNTVQLDFLPDYGSVVEVGYNVYIE